ncbi:Mitochondrial matrix cochaperone [Saitozyma podzolica]|uniref:GrpE protein homolog, mitochondrial n=1 Tax=Saitozyma podzolica TaxID=1890683 RepID=A0A427Y3G8_9TREE|nr:Mitochondrial matrix cochaperone [Saitozyma podzolica]
MYARTLAPLRALSRTSLRPTPTPSAALALAARPTAPLALPRATAGFGSRPYSARPSEETDGKSEVKADEDGNGEKGESDKLINSLEKMVKELEKDILYHRAELQTVNRRVIDERAKASEFAITSFARSLLSTDDVLHTALSHVPKPVDPSNKALADLVQGVELTHKALLKTFEQNGVKKMELNKGDAFDPNLHEATFQIPREVAGQRADGKEWGPGEIVEVGKEGWLIGNRVLRPAQVGVTQIE